MSMNEFNESIPYIEKLITLSKSGQFAWTRISPTVFVHTDALGRLTLQQVRTTKVVLGQQPEVATYVILQGHQNASAGQPTAPGQVLLLDGRQSASLNAALATLYSVVVENVVTKGIDFLRAMVEKGAGPGR